MSTPLSATISFVQPFVSNLFLENDNTLNPAIGLANMIVSSVMVPPFVWEWNRYTIPFTCVVGQTDYVLTPQAGSPPVANFGFIESAYVLVTNDGSVDAGRIFQLSIQRSLEKSSDKGKPDKICVFTDDGAGDITFRLSNAPDQTYTGVITYQGAPTLFSTVPSSSGVNANWPIPDKLNMIYNWGMLALACLYTNDPRWQTLNQKFVAHLLAAQSGLDEMQRDLFASQWMQFTSQLGLIGLKNTQSTQARGV